jgi:hypothetical protein
MSDLWVTETGVRRHRQDASRDGRSICGRRIRYGAMAAHDQYALCGQCERLNRLASSELATPTGDVLAEHGAGETQPPVPRDPRNPAEDEMPPNDNETYREEQNT